MIKRTEVIVRSPKITRPLTLAFVADFHDGNVDDVLALLHGCDAILIGGDLVHRHRRHGWHNALTFLHKAVKIAPTFYNIGNHERRLKDIASYWPLAEQSGAVILDDSFVDFRGIVLGGLSSVLRDKDAPDYSSQLQAKQPFLTDMASQGGFKLLLCHHPELFPSLISPYAIDLTLSGHAHGGQMRIGSQGLYAPGQGLLPKLTSGFYCGNRLFVSRGVTNSTFVPRFRCPCELVILKLLPDASVIDSR